METKQTQNLGKLSHNLLHIAWYIQIILFGLVLIYLMLLQTNMFDNSSLKTTLPLDKEYICLNNEYINQLKEEGVEINNVDNGYVSLNLKMDTAKRLAIFEAFRYLIWLSISIYITFLLKKITKTIKDKTPFSKENNSIIKRIGKVVILITPISIILFQFNISVFHRQFVLSFGSEFITTLYYGIIPILLGGAFYVLADIFKTGTIIQEEQNLTV